MTAPEVPAKKSALSWLIDPVWAKLEPFLDRKFDELTDKVLALLPLIAASAGSAAANAALKAGRDVVDDALKGDPDIPVLSDIFDVSEAIRAAVNGSTPVGVHIPNFHELSDLFNRQPGL